jgi:hypothetical protein
MHRERLPRGTDGDAGWTCKPPTLDVPRLHVTLDEVTSWGTEGALEALPVSRPAPLHVLQDQFIKS